MTSPAPESPRARRGRPSHREEIFAAALQLFRERGFHATTIEDIGVRAGVSGTAVYSHFATKQELLAEAIREGARRIREGLADALADDDPSPWAALEKLVRDYVRVVLENADMNACYVLESRNLDPGVREPLLRAERGLRGAFRRHLMALRPELDAAQASTMVQMAIFAVAALCVHRNPIERDRLVELATAQVLGALRSPVSRTSNQS